MIKTTESIEQRALVQNARLFRELKSLFAVPNGAHLKGTKIQRARQMRVLKAEGFMNGVSDLVLPEPIMFRPLGPGECHGLYLEMKRTGKSVTSEDQLAFGDMVMDRGYEFHVAHGLNEGIAILEEHLRRMKEALIIKNNL